MAKRKIDVDGVVIPAVVQVLGLLGVIAWLVFLVRGLKGGR